MPCGPTDGMGTVGVGTAGNPCFVPWLLAFENADAYAAAALHGPRWSFAVQSAFALRLASCCPYRIPTASKNATTAPSINSTRNVGCRHHGPVGVACRATIPSIRSGGSDSGSIGSVTAMVLDVLVQPSAVDLGAVLRRGDPVLQPFHFGAELVDVQLPVFADRLVGR